MFESLNGDRNLALANPARAFLARTAERASAARTVREGKSVPLLGSLLYHLYRIPLSSFRDLIASIVLRLEGGELLSLTMRRIFREYYGIDVGMYTFSCFHVLHFRPNTKIGRYCSIYHTVHAFNANHPMNLISTHPYFFNNQFGKIRRDLIERTRLEIGNDVFIGHNVTLLPTVTSIGDGAIIGAGSVVSRDVPPYGIVIGNPARLVRFRFSREIVQKLTASKWWEQSIDELAGDIEDFQVPLNDSSVIR
jgi:acetyltransferase-like isoleucine patch superfamily enzyme